MHDDIPASMDYRAAGRLAEAAAAAVRELRASIHTQNLSLVNEAAEDLIDIGGRLLDLTEAVKPS